MDLDGKHNVKKKKIIKKVYYIIKTSHTETPFFFQ